MARSDCCYFLSSSNSMLIYKSTANDGEHFSKNCKGLKNTWGTSCGKGGPSVAAISGPGGPFMAKKIAEDGPGDHLWWGTNCSMTAHLSNTACHERLPKTRY